MSNEKILQAINKEVASMQVEKNESKIIDLEKGIITLVKLEFGSTAEKAVTAYLDLKNSDSVTTEEIYKVIDLAVVKGKELALATALAFFKAAKLTTNNTVHWSCVKLALEYMEKAYNGQTIHAIQQFVEPRNEETKFSTAIIGSYDLAADLTRIIERNEN